MATTGGSSAQQADKSVVARIFIRLTIMLLVGVVVSIAVALALPFTQDATKASWTSEQIDGKPVFRGWFRTPPAGTPEPTSYSWSGGTGYLEETVSHQPPMRVGVPMAVNSGISQTRCRSGFPFPALQAHSEPGPFPPARIKVGPIAVYDFTRGAAWWQTVGSGMTMGVTIPISPFWPGLVFDAIFYGVGLGSLVLWLAGIRRRRRLRRGQCLKCGYALAGLNNCPECGTPAPARTIH